MKLKLLKLKFKEGKQFGKMNCKDCQNEFTWVSQIEIKYTTYKIWSEN